MDTTQLMALLHQVLPPGTYTQVTSWLGSAALAFAALAKGPAYALKAADWLANLALNSPARPLVLWAAPTIVAYLDNATELMIQTADTFRDELKADLAKAAQPAQAPQQPAPGAPPAP